MSDAGTDFVLLCQVVRDLVSAGALKIWPDGLVVGHDDEHLWFDTAHIDALGRAIEFQP